VSLAVREAVNNARRDDVILITGSLYVVGDAMTALGVEPE
jgi:folylpolyglutamate synthase/dihydropteroate synthase